MSEQRVPGVPCVALGALTCCQRGDLCGEKLGDGSAAGHGTIQRESMNLSVCKSWMSPISAIY